MLGTQTVKNYFDNPAAQVLPFISGEWNYNLIYRPYATFSGNGINYASKYNPDNWALTNITGSNKLSKRSLTTGYKTSVFDGNVTQFYITPGASKSDLTNFQGNASIDISLPVSGAKSYKVIFYVRSNNNNIINLTSQIINNTSGLNATSFNVVDNIDWIKVEIVGGVKSTAPAFDSLTLSLDFFNSTFTAAEEWGITITAPEIYEISYFDYLYGNLYPTSDVFTYFRPGESYITSGNISIDDQVRTISDIPSIWDVSKNAPVSCITYSPRVLFGPGANPIYKNGALTSFSNYKYFVSETSDTPSIGAAYTELISINKIVIKLNLSQSKPKSLSVKLYTKDSLLKTISVDSSSIKDSGYIVLYYNGTDWSTNKWSTMPTLNNSGQITISQQINKIVVTQMGSTINSGYSNISTESTPELKRFQVVEISPRLELDLSSFVLDYSITKELDDKSTPLPISSISANSATISFSNIPLAGTNNAPLSVFSTNANHGFITPLANMLVKNTKFYINFYIPEVQLPGETKKNRLIPGGVFYADTWDNQDIKTTRVNCFDIMKFLQTLPVADYVSGTQDLVNLFTNILDLSGFTDYNYDELKSVLSNNNQKVHISYFFADSATKSVYTVLKELFLAYQIGAHVDEYGVLRFKNLQAIITNNVPTYIVNDGNVVVDSYNENIKTKIGKVRMLYKSPQVKRSIAFNANDKAVETILTQAPDIIWQQDSEDVVPFNFITDSISSLSQNYYQTDPATLNPDNLFYLTTFDHNSFIIVEGEIMSSGDKEILFSSKNAVPATQPKKVSIANQNEIGVEAAKYSSSINSQDISQSPTGKYTNVHRGLFGTPASKHIVMKNADDVKSKFDSFKNVKGSITISNSTMPSTNATNYITFPVNSDRNMISPKSYDSGFYTYSVKFRYDNKFAGNISAGLFFNLSGNPTILDKCYFISLTQSGSGTTRKYMLSVYSVSDIDGSITQIINPIDVTSSILSDFANEPRIPIYASKSRNFINLKLVNSSGKICVYINKHKYKLGNTTVITDPKTKEKTNVLTPISDFSRKSLTGTRFGFFTETTSATSTSVELAEVYASDTKIDEPAYYHFQTKDFLDKIIDNKRVSDSFVFVQSSPQIIGLNYYDVQLTPNPSLGAEPFKVMYNLYYIEKNNATKSTLDSPAQLISVYDNALGYSTVLSTGFRARFAVTNNSSYTVWTKTGTDYNKSVAAQFFVGTRKLIMLTEQQTVERVLNPQNINEVVELQSDWIQDKKSANSILKLLANSSEWFSKDITVEIFGNPLVQVGDILSLTHTLKNISNLTFFVQSVRQTFNQGLKTILMINQIGYDGNGSVSKDLISPTTGASGNLIGDLKLSPSYGSYNGGDTIRITANNFTTNPAPLVYFDETVVDGITVIDSKTLDVITPQHAAGSVSVSVVSGNITTTQYDAFTYNQSKPIVGNITDLLVTQSSGALGTVDVTLSWTPTQNQTHYDWSYSTTGFTGDSLYNSVPSKAEIGSAELTGVFGQHVIYGLKANGLAYYDFSITPKNIFNNIETVGNIARVNNVLLGSPSSVPSAVPAQPVFKSNPTWTASTVDLNVGSITIPIVKDTSSTKPTSYKVILQGNGNDRATLFNVADLTGGSDYYNLILSDIAANGGRPLASGLYAYTVNIIPINSAGSNTLNFIYYEFDISTNAAHITNKSINTNGVVTFNGSSGIDYYEISYIPSATSYYSAVQTKTYTIDLSSNWKLKSWGQEIPGATQVFTSPNSFSITPPSGDLSAGVSYDAWIYQYKNGTYQNEDYIGKITIPTPTPLSPPSIPQVSFSNDISPVGGTFYWTSSGNGSTTTFYYEIINSVTGIIVAQGSTTNNYVAYPHKGTFRCFVTASNSGGITTNNICPPGYTYSNDGTCYQTAVPHVSINATFLATNGCVTATFT